MAKEQIHVPCQQCGHPMLVVNKKRRLCHVCQAERDLRKLTRNGTRARGKSCTACGERFYPIRSNYDLCPTCVEFPRPDRFPACKHCGKCYRPAPGLDDTDRGCWVCITATPKNQKRYYNTVRDLVVERINTPSDFDYKYDWPPPDDWPGSAFDWLSKQEDEKEITF